MKTLEVFETLTGEWCAGTWTGDIVFAATEKDAIKAWRLKNPGRRVKTIIR